MLHIKQFFRSYQFSTAKVAILKDYKFPAPNPQVNNNIVWLHGMFDSSKNFFKVAETPEIRNLGNHTLLDARNHGLSQHTDNFTVDDMVTDLVDYIANRDMKNLYLIGHSMGGRTVMAALRHHGAFFQDRVKGVIIIDTLPCSYTQKGIIPIESIHRFMSEVNSISLANKTLNEIEKELNSKFEKSVADNIMSSIEMNDNNELKWLNNFQIIEKSFNELMQYEMKDIMWSGPRKLLIGGKSHFTSMERVLELYPSIFADFQPERDLVEFKESGHFLYVKEHKRFVDEVVKFIKNVDETHSAAQAKKKKLYDESLTYDF